MGKNSNKKKSEKSDKKLHISDIRSGKMTKEEIHILVVKNRVRNLTTGF